MDCGKFCHRLRRGQTRRLTAFIDHNVLCHYTMSMYYHEMFDESLKPFKLCIKFIVARFQIFFKVRS